MIWQAGVYSIGLDAPVSYNVTHLDLNSFHKPNHEFTESTRDDRLHQPVFVGRREDKDASEVIREKATTAPT